jgi:hypothetical protein
MENLKASVRHTVDGHEELGVWNSWAVEAIRILDRIKVNQKGVGMISCFYFICTWAWARSIGRRRGIPNFFFTYEIFLWPKVAIVSRVVRMHGIMGRLGLMPLLDPGFEVVGS